MPVVEATVSKGQRSMNEITSELVRFEPGKAVFKRVAIAGAKVARLVLSADEAMAESMPVSKAVQRSWLRVLFEPVASEMMVRG